MWVGMPEAAGSPKPSRFRWRKLPYGSGTASETPSVTVPTAFSLLTFAVRLVCGAHAFCSVCRGRTLRGASPALSSRQRLAGRNPSRS
ncbi:hypothetical protein GCM10010211_56040 [Streptomyces albospinus]|uniref:Uncharacterized protein n=1 Tax=Streptomyces albospinus TaxID=285515 RepID=A0ABQ2VI17_9ACTN|nr:hypothetical protein GCM10010211_56040 [Streptomyces albospinus]